MITATFTEHEKKLSLRLEGHAGYAEIGKDIVCASASILAYTLASVVESIDDVVSSIKLSSGDTIIECECKNDTAFAKVIDAYRYTQTGFALLAQNYPQYVRLMP